MAEALQPAQGNGLHVNTERREALTASDFHEGNSGLFERFTDRARRVVVWAQEEARMLNHNYIGTEHLLLGLLEDGEGVAAQALSELGFTLEGVRSQVQEIIGQGHQHAPSGHIPFTPHAKKALEQSLRESLQLGNNFIGTEHLLLGVVRGDGGAKTVLAAGGADATEVRRVVIRILTGYATAVAEPAAPSVDELQRRVLEAQVAAVTAERDLLAARLRLAQAKR